MERSYWLIPNRILTAHTEWCWELWRLAGCHLVAIHVGQVVEHWRLKSEAPVHPWVAAGSSQFSKNTFHHVHVHACLYIQLANIILLPHSHAHLRPEMSCHTGVTMWLVKWLLFRLMFASGVVKLTSHCPTWWGLTALNYHYESQVTPWGVGGRAVWLISCMHVCIRVSASKLFPKRPKSTCTEHVCAYTIPVHPRQPGSGIHRTALRVQT